MRITAFPISESDLSFDFSAAALCDKHDTTNTVFPGVDFIVEETGRQIWLEVKNWEGASVPARRRGGQRRAFLARMKSKTYFSDVLRTKFIGTCAYMTLTNTPPTKEILFIALLESPRIDSALLSHVNTRLRGLIARPRIWHLPISAVVVNLAEWQARFPQYPTDRL